MSERFECNTGEKGDKSTADHYEQTPYENKKTVRQGVISRLLTGRKKNIEDTDT